MRALRATIVVTVAASIVGIPAVAHGQFPSDARGARAEWETRERVEVSVGGGAFMSSDWSDLVLLGVESTGTVFQEVLVRDVAVHPGPLADLAVTYWRGRLGFRGHLGVSRSCLAIGAGCVSAQLAPTVPDTLADLFREEETVYTYLYDVSAVFGLVTPRPGRTVWPYLVAGLGGVTYDPGDVVRTIFPSFVVFGGSNGRLVPDGDGDLVLNPVVVGDDSDLFVTSVDEVGFETVFAGVLGVGTNIRLGGVGLKLEITDHIARSPLDVNIIRFQDDFGFNFFGVQVEDDDVQEIEFDFGLVHNIRLIAALAIEFPVGRRPAQVVRTQETATSPIE